MSAPTPAPGDDRPREGYYPDPSIPGYVRYWNGASWVPGTSRPAPSDGEPLAPPSGPGAGGVEETGPHFFDEDPDPARPASDSTLHGSRPEPASAWGADRSRQTGFGGDKDRRVSWGSPPGPAAGPADPRMSLAAAPGDDADSGRTASTDGTATIPPADVEDDAGVPEGTVVFRRPNTSGRPQPAEGTPVPPGVFGAPLTSAQVAAQQALGLAPQGSQQGGSPQGGQQGVQPGVQQGPQSGATAPAAAAIAPATPAVPATPVTPVTPAAPVTPTPPAQRQPQSPQFGGAFTQQPAPTPAPTPQAPPSPVPQPAAGVPPQAASRQSGEAPMAVGSGGGQPSWAQQVHRLAEGEGEQLVAPWKPVVEDPFQAVVRRQAEARPAGFGRRLVARLLDSLIVGAVTAVAAVPFGTQAVDHVNDKIEAARLSGEKVTVWLVDGTTSVQLGIILGVLFVVSALYEVLPTAKWGRTLGKKLLGLDVRDIEGHEPPSLGRSLRRWLVHAVPGLLGIGVIGILWCLIDKPWRQCWHDKAAHTFVAGK
ncbi:RDD family protein [Streptomyces adelaidensis]|uniref:RDD family protein n=1 Tax=Streptomyces adelaidensis TaxID=2796465 RepID=UPI001907E66D|nr:RDD family protein [Streptomyces adelaidensis]